MLNTGTPLPFGEYCMFMTYVRTPQPHFPQKEKNDCEFNGVLKNTVNKREVQTTITITNKQTNTEKKESAHHTGFSCKPTNLLYYLRHNGTFFFSPPKK